jgi:hypothetical protein
MKPGHARRGSGRIGRHLLGDITQLGFTSTVVVGGKSADRMLGRGDMRGRERQCGFSASVAHLSDDARGLGPMLVISVAQ